ncbi:hypothetical protein [Methylobacterium adhaesivum]|uniref:Uncharacterized protein n=1 Tax=Methylobacterium adhaesivum TaxID=333297 RepID=A0ABT8BIF8_9HYPH|nr:hypothetical protein [Methylobacterium adhaesivum]MDN3591673.1 hypothetical protein [Methylobacterium adhaesivum]
MDEVVDGPCEPREDDGRRLRRPARMPCFGIGPTTLQVETVAACTLNPMGVVRTLGRGT